MTVYTYTSHKTTQKHNWTKKNKRVVRLYTLDLGVGLSPAIDNTIQFSEFPDVHVLISGTADGHWLSSLSDSLLVIAAPSA